MAVDLREADEMLTACERNGVKLLIAFQRKALGEIRIAAPRDDGEEAGAATTSEGEESR